MSLIYFFEGEKIPKAIEYDALDLANCDYQCVVDTLQRMGDQFNKRSRRFHKSDIICESIEAASGGRLKYVDEIGYDSIDQITDLKYEIKSEERMFTPDGKTLKPIVLRNTLNRKEILPIDKTFDYLFVIETNLRDFAIAEFDWKTCFDNHYYEDGRFKMKAGLEVKKWICKDRTRVRNVPVVTLDFKKFFEPIIYG